MVLLSKGNRPTLATLCVSNTFAPDGELNQYLVIIFIFFYFTFVTSLILLTRKVLTVTNNSQKSIKFDLVILIYIEALDSVYFENKMGSRITIQTEFMQINLKEKNQNYVSGLVIHIPMNKETIKQMLVPFGSSANPTSTV